MAPEQAELKPLSAQTDIYALGLLLYEMITGVPAFDGDSPVAVALKQIREYPTRPREIVPQLTRAVESVIMKCLQKDPAKRFSSAMELEIALLRASKARNASPWEVVLNRNVDRAEAQVRNYLGLALEHAQALAERQNWQQMKQIQQDPKAMLGVTGIVSAMAVFMIFGAWKPRTTNAQSVPLANRGAAAATSTSGAYPDFRTARTPNSLAPLASHEVNLYADSSAAGNSAARSIVLDEVDLTEAPAAKSPQSNAKPQRASDPAKPAIHATQSKPHSNVSGAAPAQPALAIAAQPEAPAASSSPKPAVAEPAAASAASQPEESIFPSAGVSAGAAGSADSKSAKFFVEVGSFKDETWADSAVEKLTHLGFHAVVLHKNLLWKNSYHVQVGPYSNSMDASDARESLAAQGFKGHVVN